MDLMAVSARRPLGKTGFLASRLGIGDLADRSMEAGLNVIDTAPSYETGYSEQIVGQAVLSRREGMFVIDKIDEHDKPVGPQVQASLVRLGLKSVDCFVFHGVSTMAAWEKLAARGGGFDQLQPELGAGRARFAGLSGHHPEVVRAAVESGRCDLVMFAAGPWCDERFLEALQLARKRGVATVCFKCFGAGKLLGDTAGYGKPLQARPRGKFSSGGQAGAAPTLPHLSVRQCLHYTLSLDPDVALLGLSFANEQDEAYAAARDFSPLSPREMQDIRRQAAEAIADKGPCWWNPE
jgi:aryl-alcohol dehydrogenase-like predicted oxidoreductase